VGQRLFEKEKDKIVKEEVEILNEEFDKKMRNFTMQMNIERSTKINQSRLKKMTARNECMLKVLSETRT
jgi:V-type H+-transporting ATPase subunit E